MRGLVVAVAAIAVSGILGCGGGSSGGGGGGNALLLSITARGIPGPLWESPGITPPNCPTNLPLNAPIIFTFGGAVDPASLPAPGQAIGSIQITIPGTGTDPTLPAFGGFAVQDDPSMPPGNNRRVVFTPVPPSDPTNPQSAGFATPATYTIFVPRGGSSSQVLVVEGRPLQNEALTCFSTCEPPVGGSASVCFTDPVPGNPFITETYPESGVVSPAPFDPSELVVGNPLNPFATQDNTVTMFFSEPLFPESIDLANVKLINDSSGAQVPGQVTFYQAGSLEAGPQGSRIDYIASSPLLSSVTYSFDFSALVRDFGDNPVDQVQGNPSAILKMDTQAVPFCPQPPITEPFNSTTNLDTLTTPVVALWGNSGVVQGIFPLNLVGDGSFGPMTFAAGNHTLDTGMPAAPGFQDGVWNTTLVTVNAGANVRVIGNRPAHIRSLGAVSVAGIFNSNAGTSQFAPIGSPEQGPRPGQFDNGSLAGQPIVFGGQGGAGAGKGGDASQNGSTRTEMGQDGFGPTINGMSDPSGIEPATYGGGQGGDSGFFPAQTPGELGGLGGAGGSAWAAGLPGQPEDNTMGCAPITGGPQPIAQPTGQTAAFNGPILQLSAGSGGGGGGDHLDTTGVQSDDQGGGGGGGGGGLRISSIGDISVSLGGVITCNGATGAQGSLFAGAGAGGSGGMIWMQTFGQIIIDPQAAMQVDAGGGNQACTRFKSGAGGLGLYQFEDSDGMVNTNFIGSGSGGGQNIFVLLFPFSTTVEGSAISKFYDTGYGAPDYISATTNTSPEVMLGDAPGAEVQIFYQGAFESLTQPGTPDPSTVSMEVTGTQIDLLDGFRFIRFRVFMKYNSPPATSLNNVLPTVQQVNINFEAPVGCP
jgi:hypothetical protein